jgi:hypothetical protein
LREKRRRQPGLPGSTDCLQVAPLTTRSIKAARRHPSQLLSREAVDNESAMSDAVIALLGIVAGGLLSGAVQLVVTWRERRNRSRAAARILFSNLWAAREAYEYALAAGAWWDRSLPRGDWAKYRDQLAAGMDGVSFQRVSQAFYSLNSQDDARQAGRPFDRDSMETGFEDIKRALGIVIEESLTRRDRLQANREIEAQREKN